MGVVPKKPGSTPLQVNRRHHKKTRPSFYKDPIFKGNLPPHVYRRARECFQAHQKQNRAWLHNQMTMPSNNGISKYQHKELKAWFSIPTIQERNRAPLAKNGVRLSQASQVHITRLEAERNAEREKQGRPGDWEPVGNWWQGASRQIEDDGKKKRKARRRERIKKNDQENRQARKFRAFGERKDKEREEKEAAARLVEMRKGIGKMRIEDQDEEDMVFEESEEETSGGEMAIESLNEEEEEKTELRLWTDELPIRGVQP